MYTIYVIKSRMTGKIYIGQTDNLEQRLKRHNGEIKAKTTSFTTINKGPWIVVYAEPCKTRPEALKREKYLKSHVGRDYLRNMGV